MSNLNNLTSTNASGIGIGPNGATNPILSVDCSQASAAAGVKVQGKAAGSGAFLSVTSSGTNENLSIDAKGSGTISLGTVSTGAIAIGAALGVTGAGTVTSTSASALAVGANGATNPVLKVDASTSSVATGLQVKGAAAAGGLALSVVSSGTNENLTIDAKGSGTISLGGTSTGVVTTPRALLSSGATAGIGYATGAGGAVTQATGRTTGVTLNTVVGAITLVSAAGSATPASFTLTNSAIGANDVVDICQKSGTDLYQVFITAVAAGSCKVTFFTTGGTTTEQPVFNFCITKGVIS